MKKVLAIFCLFLLTQCKPSEQQDIQGLWRTDSISNYVNGFTYTLNTFDEHWSKFEYTADGKLFERRKDEFRQSAYKFITPDSLIYADSTGKFLSGYKILKLNEKNLILKKIQKPYLPGKNQTLYETRFFSKIPADSISSQQ